MQKTVFHGHEQAPGFFVLAALNPIGCAIWAARFHEDWRRPKWASRPTTAFAAMHGQASGNLQQSQRPARLLWVTEFLLDDNPSCENW
jgi:NAD dependent epimerase/dehydratase family enzyme